MNKERLKLIVRNMELLVQSFKDELELEETTDYNYNEMVSNIDDYDEIYCDDDDNE